MTPQHMQALERANYLYRRRAAIRRRLWIGEIVLSDVDLSDPDLDGMKVGQLIAALGWQPNTHTDRAVTAKPGLYASQLLADLHISPQRTIGALTDRQREVLVATFMENCPTQRIEAAA